ncbi:MAG: cell division protein SepF [Bacteroides sp.]|nr:cell division protein SepF [Bacteroides sp.]
MGLVNSLKKFVGYEEEDDELDYNDGEDIDEGGSTDDDFSFKRSSSSITSAPKSGKVLNIPATTRLQVIVFKAERFNDVVEIADHFKNKKAIVLNLDNTNKDVANRLIDFLAGVAYAADGELKRIANTSYILVPYNVDISGDLLEELGSDIMQ